ncbi:MAG: GTPase HflX [Myxococcota bacterium]
MSRPRAVLVSVQLPGVDDAEHASSLDELGRLARTLGLEVAFRLTQKRDRIDPGAVLGAGKLRELARLTGGDGEVPSGASPTQKKQVYVPTLEREEEAPAPPDLEALPPEERATVVLVDHDLGPSQARNLEKAAGVEVMDRTSVILGIFHRHARSREAKIEVEIARLKYLSPRLREVGGGGDRQRGGVGGRGAGESSLELDRRKIRDRIAELARELDTVRKVSATQRSRRQEQRKVALVGYTNAGKSSTMRALTGKEVYVADALFATLGTTVRVLPGVTPRVLVSDTVGFIKKLPHDLVASFRATLDEAASAELLLHVVDASDSAFRSHMEVTNGLLDELGVAVPRRLLLNKVDRLSTGTKALRQEEFPDALQLSAHDGEDMRQLAAHIADFFDCGLEELVLLVPWSQQGRLPRIHEHCRVLDQGSEATGTRLRVRAPPEVADSLRDLALR